MPPECPQRGRERLRERRYKNWRHLHLNCTSESNESGRASHVQEEQKCDGGYIAKREAYGRQRMPTIPAQPAIIVVITSGRETIVFSISTLVAKVAMPSTSRGGLAASAILARKRAPRLLFPVALRSSLIR
eukprot:4253585-Pyramimonas_sp.AAC.1